jgi:hypothetical protein
MLFAGAKPKKLNELGRFIFTGGCFLLKQNRKN